LPANNGKSVIRQLVGVLQWCWLKRESYKGRGMRGFSEDVLPGLFLNRRNGITLGAQVLEETVAVGPRPRSVWREVLVRPQLQRWGHPRIWRFRCGRSARRRVAYSEGQLEGGFLANASSNPRLQKGEGKGFWQSIIKDFRRPSHSPKSSRPKKKKLGYWLKGNSF